LNRQSNCRTILILWRIVADRLQGYLRERAKRGDVIKAGKRRDAQWALAPALV
jgi:hypothetical protein